MRNVRWFVAAAALGAAGVLSSGASALPGQALPRVAVIEQARIVCDVYGRCFRVDPYGRRFFVPRGEAFGGYGYGYGNGYADRGYGDRGGGYGGPGIARPEGDDFGRPRPPRRDFGPDDQGRGGMQRGGGQGQGRDDGMGRRDDGDQPREEGAAPRRRQYGDGQTNGGNRPQYRQDGGEQ